MLKKLSKLLVATAITGLVLFASSIPTLAAAKHNVTFVYGTKVYTQAVEDGGTVLPPADTYVPGYTFNGWVGSSVNVKSDVTILGAYTKDAPVATPAPATTTNWVNHHNHWCTPFCYGNLVRFVDGLTGVTYNVQMVGYGHYPVEPAVPKHEGYHFAGYGGDFTPVNSERTFVAIFHKDGDCECAARERMEAEKIAEQQRIALAKQIEAAEQAAALERIAMDKQLEEARVAEAMAKAEAERQAEIARMIAASGG